MSRRDERLSPEAERALTDPTPENARAALRAVGQDAVGALDETLLHSVHIARIEWDRATDAEVIASHRWLRKHGKTVPVVMWRDDTLATKIPVSGEGVAPGAVLDVRGMEMWNGRPGTGLGGYVIIHDKKQRTWRASWSGEGPGKRIRAPERRSYRACLAWVEMHARVTLVAVERMARGEA